LISIDDADDGLPAKSDAVCGRNNWPGQDGDKSRTLIDGVDVRHHPHACHFNNKATTSDRHVIEGRATGRRSIPERSRQVERGESNAGIDRSGGVNLMGRQLRTSCANERNSDGPSQER